MLIVIYDTEGTGTGRKDEVIQLAYIVTNMKMEILGVFNKYCFSNRPIDPGAYAAHGIDRDTLLELSKKVFFEQIIANDPIFTPEKNVISEKDVIFIAYNGSYDMRLINSTLANNTGGRIDFGEKITKISSAGKTGRYNLCAYEALKAHLNYGYPIKLTEMAKKYLPELSPRDLEDEYKVICHRFKVDSGNSKAHDALYDAMITWRLLLKYRGWW